MQRKRDRDAARGRVMACALWPGSCHAQVASRTRPRWWQCPHDALRISPAAQEKNAVIEAALDPSSETRAPLDAWNALLASLNAWNAWNASCAWGAYALECDQ